MLKIIAKWEIWNTDLADVDTRPAVVVLTDSGNMFLDTPGTVSTKTIEEGLQAITAEMLEALGEYHE